MKPVVAIIPKDSLIRQIYKVRQEVVKRNWVDSDTRSLALPHASLYYFKEYQNPHTTKEILNNLTKLKINSKIIKLKVFRIRSFRNKIALMFDNQPLRSIYHELSQLFDKLLVSENQNILFHLNQLEQALGEKTYSGFEEITGDHIKICRNVKNDFIKITSQFLDDYLPKIIYFDRLVLIDQGCTESDILWEQKLN